MTTLEIYNKITKDGILITDTPIQLDNDTYVSLFKTKKNDYIARIDEVDDISTYYMHFSKEIRSLPNKGTECVIPVQVASNLSIQLYKPYRNHALNSFYGAFASRRSETAPNPVIEEGDLIIEEVDRTEFEERIKNLKQNISKSSSDNKKKKKKSKKDKEVKESKEE